MNLQGRLDHLRLFIFLAVLLLPFTACDLSACPCGGSIDFSPDYHFSWSIESDEIVVTIKVDALVWVAVGWHQQNPPDTEYKMIDADMVIAIFNATTGNATVKDYWSTAFAPPSTDIAQGGVDDILTFQASQLNGTSYITWTRKLVTGDNGFDWPLEDANRTVVWARGTGQVFGYHAANRGLVTFNFFQPAPPSVPTVVPTELPTANPTQVPTITPTDVPAPPTMAPTLAPTPFFTTNEFVAVIVGGVTLAVVIINIIVGVKVWCQSNSRLSYQPLQG